MTLPMIVWCVIAGVLLLTFVFKAIERHSAGTHHCGVRHHILEIGKERDIFFLPGDPDDDDDDE